MVYSFQFSWLYLQRAIKMSSCELEVKCTVQAQAGVNALQDVAKELRL